MMLLQFSGFEQVPEVPGVNVPGVCGFVQERSKAPTHITRVVDELNHPEKKNYGFDVFTVDDWMFPADLRSSAIYHRCDYLRNVLLSTSLTRMTSSGSKQ